MTAAHSEEKPATYARLAPAHEEPWEKALEMSMANNLMQALDSLRLLTTIHLQL